MTDSAACRILFQMCMPVEPRKAGVQQSVRVCYHLARAGGQVTLHVWTPCFASEQALLAYMGLAPCPGLTVRIHRARLGGDPSPIRIFWAGLFWQVRRVLKLLVTREKHAYDLYYGRGRRFPAMHAALKRWLGYKVLIELHEIAYLDQVAERDLLTTRPRGIDLERMAYTHADGVIFITRMLQTLAQKKWGVIEPSVVIPSGGMVGSVEPRPEDRDTRKIFFIGNLYPFSGIDDLIRAMEHVDVGQLVIVGGAGAGTPDHDRVAGLIDALGLGRRVEMRGYVKPAALADQYAEADVLVMPLRSSVRAKYFMSPLKLFEYMGARRAIVATDVPAACEMLRHERNALLTTPGRPSALAQAVGRLLNDPVLADRLADRAYADAQAHALENKCQKMYEMMCRVAGRPISPPATLAAGTRA